MKIGYACFDLAISGETGQAREAAVLARHLTERAELAWVSPGTAHDASRSGI